MSDLQIYINTVGRFKSRRKEPETEIMLKAQKYFLSICYAYFTEHI